MPMTSPFFLQIEKHFETLDDADPFKSARLSSFASLKKMGLPNKHRENFQYIPLREFYQHGFKTAAMPNISLTHFQSAIHPECLHSYLVFVNGILRLDLSDTSNLKEIVLLNLPEAAKSYGSFLKQRLNTFVTQEKDPFALLNLSLHTGGAFLFVPPKLELKTPIQCIHILTSDEKHPVFAAPRVHLNLGAHASLTWIHSSISLISNAWFNGLLDVSIEEGARLKTIHLIQPQNDTWHFESLRATLKKDAKLESISVTTGSKTVRQDYSIALAGEGSSASLQGIAMLKNHAQAHAHILMDHQAPNTHSMQLFKGILSDSSRSSFEGKIHVHPEAQKTEAYQLNKHMILDESALAYSKPNLEIFADDVKASHGATVTQIDPTQLFYLKTRGIDEALGKQLLISGFCQEILTQIPYPSIGSVLQSLLKTYRL